MSDPGHDSRTDPAPDAEWLVNQIAHTLRNPIFAAMVQSEALVMRAGDDARITNAAQLVHRQLKRLESNINEMLLYGRPAGLNPRRADLVELVDRLAATFRQGERGEPAQVEVVAPRGSFEVDSDPDAIKVILERLLLNAVQHTPEPHVIQVEALTEGEDSFQVTIRDWGEGIPQSVQDKMFLPFFPQHSGRPGLGLAVAAKFAHTLGGSLTIQSDEGKGTVARCTLPIESPVAE